ncbi:MAG TPA: 4a-hydroxytetrahydrobiopterin dehydratase [Thermoleophilaceae bacterium]|jgi:4a-hydroxytetrahydrobiopterin dehydratase
MAVLNDDDVAQRLESLDGWERKGDAIVKEFKCNDFAGSVKFVDALTPAAEEMNHHPDLAISWDTVTVTLSTHSEGGLTENDFELAGQIDGLGGV